MLIMDPPATAGGTDSDPRSDLISVERGDRCLGI
jgi:hypothetical protein